MSNLFKEDKTMSRGFEVVSKFEDKNVKLPERKTEKSAGYDFHAIQNVIIDPGKTHIFETGIKAYMMDDEVLEIYIRSSLAFKRGLMLLNCTAIIDSDFYGNTDNDGHILIGMKNISSQPVSVASGEAIAQGIFKKYLTIDGDNVKIKRTGGIGSTGK